MIQLILSMIQLISDMIQWISYNPIDLKYDLIDFKYNLIDLNYELIDLEYNTIDEYCTIDNYVSSDLEYDLINFKYDSIYLKYYPTVFEYEFFVSHVRSNWSNSLKDNQLLSLRGTSVKGLVLLSVYIVIPPIQIHVIQHWDSWVSFNCWFDEYH